jgi:hypothetical protein
MGQKGVILNIRQLNTRENLSLISKHPCGKIKNNFRRNYDGKNEDNQYRGKVG